MLYYGALIAVGLSASGCSAVGASSGPHLPSHPDFSIVLGFWGGGEHCGAVS